MIENACARQISCASRCTLMDRSRADTSVRSDRLAASRSLNAARQPDFSRLDVSPAPPCAPPPSPGVQVWVSGVRRWLPEHALCAGLSDLRLATGARASLEDYGRGVALVLEALANCGEEERQCGWLVRYPETKATPSSEQKKPRAT